MHGHAVCNMHVCTHVVHLLFKLCQCYVYGYYVSYCGYHLVFSPDGCGGCISCWECNSGVHFRHERNSK